MIKAVSSPNIALIKYWGNRNNELRLPAADSLSMTLDGPVVEVTVEQAPTASVRSMLADGNEKTLGEKDIARFANHIELIKQALVHFSAPDAIPASLAITVKSAIPPGIGLASSAAVFSAVAKAVQGLAKLSDEQTSVLARLGSGSAARSIDGGFMALVAGEGDDIGAAKARQIAPADHWPLHDIVVAPSVAHKKVGSTEGHAGAATSPLFLTRIENIRRERQPECIDAILKKDFEKLAAISEEDALDMHRVMETQSPPLHYLNDDTHRIIAEIEQLRKSEHLSVLYTMDAGPTVHLICTEDCRKRIAEFAKAQKGCTVFELKIGNGSTLVAG